MWREGERGVTGGSRECAEPVLASGRNVRAGSETRPRSVTPSEYARESGRRRASVGRLGCGVVAEQEGWHDQYCVRP